MSDPWELKNDLTQCQRHLDKRRDEGADCQTLRRIEQNCYIIDRELSKYDYRSFEK